MAMTPEAWAIIVVGAVLWWAIVDRAQRIESLLSDIKELLNVLRDHGEQAPWVANQPEPHTAG